MQKTRETYNGNGDLINTETIEVPDNFERDALRSLAVTDMVALRCIKAGISFPEAWETYTLTLRAIVNGAAGPLPEQPDFPEGT